MNVPVSVYQFTPRLAGAFDELDEVRLLAPSPTRGGVTLPTGTEGTVLSVWADGAAYEVEFDQGLATVEAGRLVAAV